MVERSVGARRASPGWICAIGLILLSSVDLPASAQTTDKTCGIGVVVGVPQLKEDANRKPTDPPVKITKNRPLVITVVRANGPASKAGLFPGDRIEQIDGSSVYGLTVDQAVAKIKGKENSKVKIKFFRGTDGKTAEVTRILLK